MSAEELKAELVYVNFHRRSLGLRLGFLREVKTNLFINEVEFPSSSDRDSTMLEQMTEQELHEEERKIGDLDLALEERGEFIELRQSFSQRKANK